MFEAIRRRLSGLLDALEGGPAVSREEMDRVLAGMREELIEHRARMKGHEEEVRAYERRLEQLRDRSDVSPTDLAELDARVAERRSEVEEERAVIRDLTERFTEAVRRRDQLLAADRRTSASEAVRGAGEGAARDFDRVEEAIEDEAREVEARRSLERDLEGGSPVSSADLDRSLQEAEADELLRRLKRSMWVEGEEDPEGEGDGAA